MQAVPIPESLQQKAGVSAGAGLLVMHVEAGGPADSAGFLLGDILLDMDGRTFSDLEAVHDALGQKGAGQEVRTSFIRGGQRMDLKVTIGNRPTR
jgi:S1-C subfamily serine protease